MSQSRDFFGVPLTDFYHLGWVLEEKPFEIIGDRGRRIPVVHRSEWLESQDLPFQIACLLAAIAKCAEGFDDIKRLRKSETFGNQGTNPPRRTEELEREYYLRLSNSRTEIKTLFRFLLSLVDDCLKIGDVQLGIKEGHWAAGLYYWLSEFFTTASEYWPHEFDDMLKRILAIPDFKPYLDQDNPTVPTREYLHMLAKELFRVKFCWAYRQGYRKE